MRAAIKVAAAQKRFGAIVALAGADLTVREGTIHGLVGENGSGKTSLLRVLAKELNPDGGSFETGSVPSLVRQQLSTIPGFSVLESVVYGSEPLRYATIDWRRARREVEALSERVGLKANLEAQTADLPLGLQQRVEIIAAIYRGSRILLLDEPTSLLTPNETAGLFRVLGTLRDEGRTVLLVSHKLREIAAVSERVTVMRAGRTVAVHDPPFDLMVIGAEMVGRLPAIPERFGAGPSGAAGLALKGPAGGFVVPVGRVLGVAGVAGNGQDELLLHISGLRVAPIFGTVRLFDEDATRWTVGKRRARGLRVIPADVRDSAAALAASLHDNVVTTEPDRRFRRGWGRLDRSRTRAFAREVIDVGGVVATNIDQAAGTLSGGNLQRLVVARELSHGARIVVAHEPTRGIDIAGAAAIRERLRAFAAAGGAVLLVSSDLDELLELSNEVVVLYQRELSAAMPGAEISMERLGAMMGGVS